MGETPTWMVRVADAKDAMGGRSMSEQLCTEDMEDRWTAEFATVAAQYKREIRERFSGQVDLKEGVSILIDVAAEVIVKAAADKFLGGRDADREELAKSLARAKDRAIAAIFPEKPGPCEDQGQPGAGRLRELIGKFQWMCDHADECDGLSKGWVGVKAEIQGFSTTTDALRSLISAAKRGI